MTTQLTPQQENALTQLHERLVSVAAGYAEEEKTQVERTDNSFGILGARGSGKSTILAKLYEKLATAKKPELYPLEAIDCSVLPPEIAPGTAVLLRLKHCVEKDLRELQGRGEKLLSDLDELVGRYTRLEQSYRDLCLEISSSTEDYSYFVVRGLTERSDLREKLSNWLKEALQHLKRHAFVALLDDFDLVPAEEVRRWLRGLLDELCQTRLLFVLTADFHRLEHLSWDPKAEVDDVTGRHLLLKLLPPERRVSLEEWLPEDRRRFPPNLRPEERRLWDILKPFVTSKENGNGEGTLEALTATLLPPWPRGLRNLYHTLTAQPPPRGHGRSFLSLLATCRGESLLARRIDETELEQWVGMLKFPDHHLTREQWSEMVEAARTRATPQNIESLRPLRDLVPVPTSEDLKTLLPAVQGDERAAPPIAIELDAWSRNPAWRDPLRHDRLRVLPLRDAADAAQPLWAELLIDRGLTYSARNRATFTDTWAPAHRRLSRAHLAVAATTETLRRFFDNPLVVKARASLLWLHRPADKPECVQIGWPPLLDALRGARDPLSSDLLADLLIDTAALEGELPKIGDEKTLLLLPDELWATILLVDALERCPWSTLSAPSDWDVETYIGLAAAFVRTAYFFALHTTGQTVSSHLSKAQCDLLEVLETRDPATLLRPSGDARSQSRQERLLALLKSLFNDQPSPLLKNRNDALSRAARAYLGSPIYTSVAALLGSAGSANSASA
ncbi:MAG: hypothetical protein HY699_04660 [Deltaproteobacteria bacterium]|nr:hypothetical protein [Deltaproteobacteria bacterium]